MEATENRNRTATRNDGAFEALVTTLELEKIEFFYQFCNNSRCREVTLLVLPLNSVATPEQLEVFAAIVRRSRIPGMVLEYPDQSAEKVTMHAVTATSILTKEMTWEQITALMHGRQLAHEKESSDPECANYTHEFLPRGDWFNKSQNYRFSNEARTIPGVRHCDTDGVLYCASCNSPVFVVEVTSDGCPGTRLADKHKATNMTRKIAAVLEAQPVLLQHHVGDRLHAHPAYLTAWGKVDQSRQRYEWTEVTSWFKARQKTLHSC